MYVDDKNYHFEVIEHPSDNNLVNNADEAPSIVCTLKVFQKTRIGNIFLRDMPNIKKEKLENFAKLVKDTKLPGR
jgi:hypothetical protein